MEGATLHSREWVLGDQDVQEVAASLRCKQSQLGRNRSYVSVYFLVKRIVLIMLLTDNNTVIVLTDIFTLKVGLI